MVLLNVNTKYLYKSLYRCVYNQLKVGACSHSPLIDANFSLALKRAGYVSHKQCSLQTRMLG